MKLLHDFFRLRLAGLRTASARRAAVSPQFSVTVPAPLAKPAGGGVERAAAAPVRREPASFLKVPRRRRLGSGR
jgi:hypothetical protein